MEIDLLKVIGYSHNSLQSRALMRAVILDLYPGRTLEMNVLLDVYESGVPRTIKNEGKITDIQYVQYAQKIIDEYGLQEQLVFDALDKWIDVCLYPGASAQIKKRSISKVSSDVDLYTQPIIHKQNTSGLINPVVGNQDDYEITVLGRNIVEITKYLGFDQADMLIPTEINGKRVIGIGEDAFKQCTGIQRIIIPEGIQYISEGAFAECSNLRKVVLPTTLKQLGKKGTDKRYKSPLDRKGAFQGTAISEIDLPNGIRVIGEKSFAYCNDLVNVLFPDDLQIIESMAFYHCNSLTEIVLPSKVEKLEYGVFGSCKKLHKVTLNEGLKSIQSNVFENDEALTYLAIPKSVTEFGRDIISPGNGGRATTIGCYPGSRAIEFARLNNHGIRPLTPVVGNNENSFQVALANTKTIHHAQNLQQNSPAPRSIEKPYTCEVYDLGNGTVEISKYLGFDQTDMVIPTEINGKRVVGIGEDAFKQCIGIQQLIIPEGIQYISEGAFAECSNLRKVVLPTTLKQLGKKGTDKRYKSPIDRKGAFQGTAISEIDLPNGITVIGESSFAYCNDLVKILFPDDLRIIESMAFYHCNSLTEIALPSKVEKLEYGVFSSCKKLHKVTLNEGLKSIQSNVFENDEVLAYLAIPKSVTEFGRDIISPGNGGRATTIGCYPGSKAIEYARQNNLQIVDTSRKGDSTWDH